MTAGPLAKRRIARRIQAYKHGEKIMRRMAAKTRYGGNAKSGGALNILKRHAVSWQHNVTPSGRQQPRAACYACLQ